MGETILEKIRRETPKKGGLLARARVRDDRVSKAAAENLTVALRPHIEKAIKAWVDALGATKIAWNGSRHCWEDTGMPDHEARGKNALHIIEFAVGKAVERSMQVTGNYRDLDTLIASLKQSPEAQRMIKGGFFDSLLSPDSERTTAEGGQQPQPGTAQPATKTGQS